MSLSSRTVIASGKCEGTRPLDDGVRDENRKVCCAQSGRPSDIRVIPVRDASYDCRHCFRLGKRTDHAAAADQHIHTNHPVLPPPRRYGHGDRTPYGAVMCILAIKTLSNKINTLRWILIRRRRRCSPN